MTVRSALVQLRARAILVGLEPRQAPLSHQFMREQAVSALTRLRWETKLHSMKRSGVVGVRERSSQGKEIKRTRTPPTTIGKTGP